MISTRGTCLYHPWRWRPIPHVHMWQDAILIHQPSHGVLHLSMYIQTKNRIHTTGSSKVSSRCTCPVSSDSLGIGDGGGFWIGTGMTCDFSTCGSGVGLRTHSVTESPYLHMSNRDRVSSSEHRYHTTIQSAHSLVDGSQIHPLCVPVHMRSMVPDTEVSFRAADSTFASHTARAL